MATLTSKPDIFSELEGRYPRTVAAFAQMPDGEHALKAVAALERQWVALNRGEVQAPGGTAGEPFRYVDNADSLPECPPDNRYDVVIAGGGLGLIAGVALARRG